MATVILKETIFVETTIPSYYTARLSRDVIQSARQQLTIEWWDRYRNYFELFISQPVLDELAQGDSLKADQRLSLVEELKILPINDDVLKIAEELVAEKIVPIEYIDDALHISCAGVHGMNYLLTWNCKHIANAQIRIRIREVFSRNNFAMPVICTPEEFIGDAI